jgi:Family of unknown function (DUF5871)
MASSVILVKDLSLSDITYGMPRNLDNGAKSIPVYHKGNPIVLQTEDMRIPFGLRDGIKDDSKPSQQDKKTMEFAMDKDMAPNFYDKISALDDVIIDDGIRNSKTWFRKTHEKRDVLEALYTHMVKHYRDRETGEISDRFPPLFKTNIPMKQGQILTEVFSADRNKLDILTTDLRGARGVAIIQCTGVWIAGGKFGCSWKLLQLRVSSSSSNRITGYAFKDDDDNDYSDNVINDNDKNDNDDVVGGAAATNNGSSVHAAHVFM